MEICDVRKKLENELENDDEESDDDVFFGPVTLREELKMKDIRSRKTEIHLVKFRESLLLFRKQMNSESSSDENEILEEDEEIFAEKEDDVAADVQQVEKFDHEDGEVIESSYAETTYYSCKQNKDSRVCEDDENKTNSLSSESEMYLDVDSQLENDFVFLGAMDLNKETLELFEDCDVIVSQVHNDDDLSFEENKGNCEFERERVSSTCQTSPPENAIVTKGMNVDEPSSKPFSANEIITRDINQLVEENKENYQSQSCQTSFIVNPVMIASSKSISPSSQIFKIPLIVEPEKATHSSQTSFLMNSLTIENAKVSEPSSPIFKTPLKVKKPGNNSASKSSKYTAASCFKNSPSPTFKVPKYSPRSGKRFEHIVSPISQYINEAPPPPLIVNIRPEGNKQRKIAQSSSNYNLRSGPSTTAVSKTNPKLSKSGVSKTSLVSDESIAERFGLTIEDFNKIEDKSLKQAIKNYIRKERLSDSRSLFVKSEKVSLNNMIPVANYKGPTALAAVPVRKELDLLTKVITQKNSKIPMPTPRPVVMKHTGIRKKLQWAKDVASQKKMCHMKDGVSSPVIINLPQRLDESCMGNERSMVEVSMVEISSPSRTNTLSRK